MEYRHFLRKSFEICKRKKDFQEKGIQMTETQLKEYQGKVSQGIQMTGSLGRKSFKMKGVKWQREENINSWGKKLKDWNSCDRETWDKELRVKIYHDTVRQEIESLKTICFRAASGLSTTICIRATSGWSTTFCIRAPSGWYKTFCIRAASGWYTTICIRVAYGWSTENPTQNIQMTRPH